MMKLLFFIRSFFFLFLLNIVNFLGEISYVSLQLKYEHHNFYTNFFFAFFLCSIYFILQFNKHKMINTFLIPLVILSFTLLLTLVYFVGSDEAGELLYLLICKLCLPFEIIIYYNGAINNISLRFLCGFIISTIGISGYFLILIVFTKKTVGLIFKNVTLKTNK